MWLPFDSVQRGKSEQRVFISNTIWWRDKATYAGAVVSLRLSLSVAPSVSLCNTSRPQNQLPSLLLLLLASFYSMSEQLPLPGLLNMLSKEQCIDRRHTDMDRELMPLSAGQNPLSVSNHCRKRNLFCGISSVKFCSACGLFIFLLIRLCWACCSFILSSLCFWHSSINMGLFSHHLK